MQRANMISTTYGIHDHPLSTIRHPTCQTPDRSPNRPTNVNRILTIAPHFPSPSASQDGQGNYLTEAVPTLARVGHCSVEVLTLQIGDQPEHESGPGWTVRRFTPPKPLTSVFDLYLPKHFRSALSALKEGVLKHCEPLDPAIPVWAHGYETGGVVEAMVQKGHRVVAVPHYLVGVETLHDLELGDDTVRREAFNSPFATAIGQVTPRPIRPMGVRWASRFGHWARYSIWPRSIKTQFAKLDLERRMIANATEIVAVGPSFENEMNALYPCTVGRSRSVIAGGPREIPEPTWPWRQRPGSFRIAMVGRPTGQKGWDYAAAAMANLNDDERKRIELVIIGGLGTGSGPYSDYSKRVAQRFDALHLNRFANLGPLSHTETLAHLAGADLLLFPSVFEPLGLVIIEAMQAGCCILASNAAGPVDLLHRPWGRLVDFNDPTQRVDRLTEALQSFLHTDMSVMSEWSRAATVAGAAYTWADCVSVHLDALRPG